VPRFASAWHLRRLRGEKEPWDAFWGQRYALLGDPDGVRVNLYAALT
jgi:uncharacterized glyoxalase superfamily protein PhnB